MREKPYAVALCWKADLVLLSNGECAKFTEYLYEDLSVAFQTSLDAPEGAAYVGYDVNGELYATDIRAVESVSLH